MEGGKYYEGKQRCLPSFFIFDKPDGFRVIWKGKFNKISGFRVKPGMTIEIHVK